MKVHIISYGCSASRNNAEIIAGILKKKGHCIVHDSNIADIVIINTCIVKGPTEKKIIRKIKALNNIGKRLVITGCMPDARKEKLISIAKNSSLLGIHHITHIDRVISDHRILIGFRKEIKLNKPIIQCNPAVRIIQISEGCKNKCAYCLVRIAKGTLLSYPENEIIREVKKGIRRSREIWLTSQDNASYGTDKIHANLCHLLTRITLLKGNFKVRIGMMNPDSIRLILQNLILSYRSDNIFKFLHIPIQSGNNRILKIMGRNYTVSDVRYIISEFRKAFPDISIATDIICGFPGETENEFNDTLELIKELAPDVLNISKFWPRPGTKAAELFPISREIIKARSKKLTILFNDISLKKNTSFIGLSGEIIIDAYGKNGTMIGRNYSYRPVVVKAGREMLGKRVVVQITSATKNYLRGTIISFKD